MSDYINTSEAAERMNLSEATVRDLCQKGHLRGAMQSHNKGPWLIPEDTVNAYINNNYRRRKLISIVTVLSLIATMVSILGFLGFPNYCAFFPSLCNHDASLQTSVEESSKFTDKNSVEVNTNYFFGGAEKDPYYLAVILNVLNRGPVDISVESLTMEINGRIIRNNPVYVNKSGTRK